jgi:hypothetical protein
MLPSIPARKSRSRLNTQLLLTMSLISGRSDQVPSGLPPLNGQTKTVRQFVVVEVDPLKLKAPNEIA